MQRLYESLEPAQFFNRTGLQPGYALTGGIFEGQNKTSSK